MSVDFASLMTRYAQARSLAQLMACARDYEAAGAPTQPSWPKIRLGLTGNYSTQFLGRGLPIALAARKVVVELYESPYNQWRPEMLDAASPLNAFGPTHVVVALTSIELAYGPLRSADALVEATAQAVEAALKTTEAYILVMLPEPLADEVSDNCPAYAWRRAVCDGLRAALRSARVTLIDIEPLIRATGATGWFDDRYYDTFKLPFHPDQTPAVLALMADAVVGAIVPRCKLIISDLDDTLWGGRAGDDGWDGIDLDPAGNGRHFLRMQAFMAGLRAKGVVLAIASKNEPQVVKEVFAKRPELMLRLEDFAAAEIHWEPKSLSIARILDRLKFSTAGVVFLDDNPVERAEVHGRFPDIEVPELPDDPALRVPMLLRTGLFDHRVATAESHDRTRLYAENAARDSARQNAGDFQEFLRGLQMVLEVCALDEARERTTELIQKTNQFNLTTRRYNWSELSAVARRGFGRCYRLKDRFGDNGIISVVAVVCGPGDDARIDLWLMSCRVLGRKVEEAILVDIALRAQALGARRLVGEYIPSAKNALVSDLYQRLGFAEIGRDGATMFYGRSLEDESASASAEFINVIGGDWPVPGRQATPEADPMTAAAG